MKEFSASFIDLLERILVFNPTKRITIDEILNHEISKAFKKTEEITTCKKMVSTSIDDNKKLTVD
jgi:mitogen-activated protein kinase 15